MIVISSALLSTILLLFGTGLHPVAWLTWLGPVPVLWAAPRTGRRVAFVAASLAWLGGQSRMWPYFLGTLGMPLPAVVAVIVGQSLVFGLVTLALRRHIRNGSALAAALVVPVCWVSLEYVVSVTLPHGAWLSLAYTQADVLPVLQTAALTGPWGITFLVMGIAAGLAAAASAGVRRRRVLVATALVLVLPLAYGTWRLGRSHATTTATVTLVDTDRPDDSVDVATSQGRELLGRYLARIRALAETGAVVLAEKTFVADEKSLPTLAGPFGRLAAERHEDIVVGLVLHRAGASYNAALGFRAQGGAPALYLKHHLIPGGEGDLRPGGGLAFVSPGRGLIICKDLDFPALVRDYRDQGASVLLAPAWDFTGDGWLHSRMPVTRGVESGLTVARTSRAGRLTVSDPYGRVLTERTSGGADFTTVAAALPAREVTTLYGRFGDWFAWLCLLLLIPAAAGRISVLRVSRGSVAGGRRTGGTAPYAGRTP